MKHKLIILADLGALKAYFLDRAIRGNYRLEPLEEICFEEGRRHLQDELTDQAGRHAAPTMKAWGAPLADNHNLRLEFKQRLVKKLASQIKRLVETRDHAGCWLAAHKEIYHLLLYELPHPVTDRIEKVVPLDLVKSEPKELIEHFLNTPTTAVSA